MKLFWSLIVVWSLVSLSFGFQVTEKIYGSNQCNGKPDKILTYSKLSPYLKTSVNENHDKLLQTPIKNKKEYYNKDLPVQWTNELDKCIQDSSEDIHSFIFHLDEDKNITLPKNKGYCSTIVLFNDEDDEGYEQQLESGVSKNNDNNNEYDNSGNEEKQENDKKIINKDKSSQENEDQIEKEKKHHQKKKDNNHKHNKKDKKHKKDKKDSGKYKHNKKSKSHHQQQPNQQDLLLQQYQQVQKILQNQETQQQQLQIHQNQNQQQKDCENVKIVSYRDGVCLNEENSISYEYRCMKDGSVAQYKCSNCNEERECEFNSLLDKPTKVCKNLKKKSPKKSKKSISKSK